MQTAMQMAIEHYENLSAQGSNQAYVIAKFLKEKFLPLEKQQIIDAYYGYELYLDREFRFQQGGQAKILTFDQWYETYGSKGSDETKQ
jgi:hypothetical protein